MDTSCEFLVVVNADGTTTILTDPAQSFYDGSDDSTVGVLNNSNGSLTNIVLTSGQPIFGFDRDGLCDASPHPGGCPFGPTGYEGPGTSFSNISGDKHAGSVNFSTAVAPGGSAYFSLEAVPTSADATEHLGAGSPSELPTQCAARSTDPVNCATGNFWHDFTDISIPGRGLVPIHLARTYNSQAATIDSPFGFGWSSNYTMSARIDSGSGAVSIVQENGSQVTFVPDGSGGYTAPPRVLATLARNGDGTYTFIRRFREFYTFSTAGQLVVVNDSNRNGELLLQFSGTTQVRENGTGRTLTLQFDGRHFTQATDPVGRTVAYHYDGNGNLIEVVDVNGGHTSFTYDGAHRMLTMRSPKYFGDTTTTPVPVITNHYDSAGRVDVQTDQLGRATTLDYTSVSGSTKITDPQGNVELQTYTNGLLTAVTRGYGTSVASTWTYAYDQNTQGVTLVTDPNGHHFRASYDANGNRTSSSDDVHPATTSVYNLFDSPTSITDALGVTTTMTYDNSGNLLTSSTPLLDAGGAVIATRTTTYRYGERGNTHSGEVTSIVDPNMQAWLIDYDANGDVAAITDPLGHKTTFSYDAVGRKTSQVSARGNITGGNPSLFRTMFAFDADGLLTSATDPLGHVARWHYDLNRNADSMTDADGNITSYAYDGADELTTVTRPDGSVLRDAYFADGTLRSQSDGAGQPTSYSYDQQSRLSSMTDALLRITAYTYDPAGNLVAQRDPGGDCAAVPKVGCTNFGYDAANQRTTTSYSDGVTPNEVASYDADGRRTTLMDGTGTSMWHWDSLGRLASTATGTALPGGSQTVGYAYDLKGDLTSLAYPGTATPLTRHFDAAGNMDSVRDWLGNLTTFRYDEDNNLLTRTFPDATHVTDALSYDNASRLMGITDAKSGATFASFGYGRDSANQLTSTTSSGVPTDNNAYTYTRLNQLASVNGAAYGYDAADNLSRVTSGVVQAYDAANQLCWTGSGSGSCASPPASATAYSYDGLGDRVGRRGPVTATQYGYDQARRLTSVGMLGTLAGGELDSLAVRSDGTVVASGLNTSGQLGTGSGAKTTLTPAVVPGLTGVAAVAAGWYHSEALLGDGTIRAWGYNADGEVGNGSTADVTTPVSIGLSNIAAIAAGAFHTLALGQDGSVKAWGDNSSGQLGNGTTTRATAPTPIGLTGVTAVAAGTGHSLALKGDGTVLAWGANARGQLGNGSTAPSTAPVAVAGLSGVRAIAAGGAHSMALKSDGTVWDWGSNSFGELGNGGGPDATAPVRVAGLSGIVAIAAGTNHALALQANGTAWAWGFNGDGELGTGTVANAAAPVRVSGLGAVSAVSAGGAHSLAATADGAVWAWGYNPDGQVGNGTTSRATAPVRFGSTTTAAGGSYLYNADGLRMAKTAAGGARAFAWDLSGGSPSLLVEGAGSAATKYVYGPGGLPLEQVDPAGAVVYYHPDQLGSTRALTDAAGAVVGTSTYDSYGKLVGQAGSKTTPFGFAGEYSDAETGLVYLRARYYDPSTGQFISRDPAQLAVTTRGPTGSVRPPKVFASAQPAYEYADENPLNETDPSGLCVFCLSTLNTAIKGLAFVASATALAVTVVGTAPVSVPIVLGVASVALGAGGSIIDCATGSRSTCGASIANTTLNAVTVGYGAAADLGYLALDPQLARLASAGSSFLGTFLSGISPMPAGAQNLCLT